MAGWRKNKTPLREKRGLSVIGGNRLEGCSLFFRVSEFARSFVLDSWPVRIRFLDVAQDVFQSCLLDSGVEIEIQLAIHNAQASWIAVESFAD